VVRYILRDETDRTWARLRLHARKLRDRQIRSPSTQSV
jgi:hypothetical protein